MILLCGSSLAASATHVRSATLGESNSRFYYKDKWGHMASAGIVRFPLTHAPAKVDPRIDPRLRRAASFAQEQSNAKSKGRCWHYVKHALVAAGVINSYPKTAYAAEAGDELVRDYGFKRLSMRDPYSAPLGAVLVYGNKSRGHVEIRTKDGFVSDYHSKNACYYHLLAVYGKFSS
ncbi:MAG: hypothetical protein ABJB69_01225 [Spartobacteria bacterium]